MTPPGEVDHDAEKRHRLLLKGMFAWFLGATLFILACAAIALIAFVLLDRYLMTFPFYQGNVSECVLVIPGSPLSRGSLF